MKIKRIKLFLLILFVSLIQNTLFAQIFEGEVKDENGKNIEFVSVFIPELSHGFSTNEEGKFHFKIAAGKYTFVFQHLSYESETLILTIPQKQPLTVVMKPKVYTLNEVVVKQNAEDPAFAMMRQVIARAPYHKNQVSEYKSNVYLRGTFKIDKISGLMKKLNRKTIKENDIEDGSAYVQESVNEIEYKNGKINQRVTAIRDNFPEFAEMDASGSWTWNIYDLENEMFVTPLSTKAFRYYNFKYDGYFTENDRIVNKIMIIPKQKDDKLISGYIYILENTWDVHSYEISGKQEMIEYNFRQIFGEVLPNIMMPIRNQITAKFSVMGNKGEINSVSSIKYSDIKANSKNLESHFAEKEDSKKQEERRQKIKSLIEKPDFSNSDAATLKRTIENFENQRIRESAEIKTSKYEIIQNFNVVKDSTDKTLANEYWDSIRTFPMLDYEIQSYKRSDSILVNKPEKKERKKSIFSKIISGNRYKIDSLQTIEHTGIVNSNIGFNTVDAFTYGQKIKYVKRFENQTSLSLSGEAIYSYGRKKLLWDANLAYRYYPEARAVFYVNYSSKTVDFNEYGGINKISNTISSLLFKKNYINYYGRELFKIGNDIDILNGLRLQFSLSYQQRKQLHNNSNFSLIKTNKEYRSNNPINPYIEQDSTLIKSSRSFTISTKLSYTPCQYYKMNGRQKQVVHSDFPTFSVSWNNGISGVFSSISKFNLAVFDVSQDIDLDMLNRITYSAKIGKFFTNKKMHFSEFEHFNLSEDDIMFSPFEGLQTIMQTYNSSTNNWFINANFTYNTSRLLLKRFIFQRSLFSENLYLSYLRTPRLKHFSEIGYGLSNIFRVVGAGVFVGFEGFDYKFVRLKLSIDFGR